MGIFFQHRFHWRHPLPFPLNPCPLAQRLPTSCRPISAPTGHSTSRQPRTNSLNPNLKTLHRYSTGRTSDGRNRRNNPVSGCARCGRSWEGFPLTVVFTLQASGSINRPYSAVMSRRASTNMRRELC